MVGLVAFFYAALFLAEGVGLWKGRRWVLTGPLLKDPDARVRIIAVEVAGRRPPSGALEAALTEVALHDSNVDVRNRVLREERQQVLAQLPHVVLLSLRS